MAKCNNVMSWAL